MDESEAFLVVTPKDPVYENRNLLGRLKHHLEASIPGKRFMVAFEPLIATENDTFVVLPIAGEIEKGSGQNHDGHLDELHRRMAWLIMAALGNFDPTGPEPTVH